MFKGLLNCDTRGQGGCKGGHVDQAWHFLRKTGWVELNVKDDDNNVIKNILAGVK